MGELPHHHFFVSNVRKKSVIHKKCVFGWLEFVKNAELNEVEIVLYILSLQHQLDLYIFAGF